MYVGELRIGCLLRLELYLLLCLDQKKAAAWNDNSGTMAIVDGKSS